MEKAFLDVAAGRRKAALVLKNASVLNVFTNRWQCTDVALFDGRIAGIGQYSGELESDLSGKYIVPGFIDAHLHIESTMVAPALLVGEVVPWGTTTLIADPHEVANVSGLDGIDYMLQQTEGLPCNIYIMLPSCVPATRWEDSGAVLGAADLLRFSGHPRVLGLGEMMDYAGVTAGEDCVLEKLSAFAARPKDGHAPLLSGKALQAYRAAGILTDHEASDAAEAAEKIAAGFYLLAREGSAAKNVGTLMRAALEQQLPFSRFAFCTDDKHIEDIRRDGHIRENIKIAIALGVPVIEAYKMASFYAAQLYGLSHLGALGAGYQADLVVLDSPEDVTIHSVYHHGRLAAQGPAPLPLIPAPAPEAALHTVNIRPVTEAELALRCTDEPQPVIELVPHQLVTRFARYPLPQQSGFFTPNREFAKMACIERHHASGARGLGVVKGFQLHGALATTVGHDSHNLLALGDSDADLLLAIRTVAAQGGGFVQVQDGRVLGSLPLPVFGLISDGDVEAVQHTLAAMKQTAHAMGVPEHFDPFITMSFLALPVIPELRLTDRGLFDSLHMAFV